MTDRKTYPRPADDAIIVCKTCRKELPAIEFATSKVQPGGTRVHCKACWKANQKKKKGGGATYEVCGGPEITTPERTAAAATPRGLKTSLVKLPGKKSGWAAKIFIRGRWVATVSDPHCTTREDAQAAASDWNRTYRRKLRMD